VRKTAKLLTILAILTAICLSFTACSDGGAAPPAQTRTTRTRDTQAPAALNTTPYVADNDTGGALSGEAGVNENDQDEDNEDESGTDSADSNPMGARLGTWDGDTLINEWANISFTVPEGFTRLSEGEMQAVLGLGEDIMVSGGAITEAEIDFSKSTYAYEFFLMGENMYPQIFLMYQADSIGSLGVEGFFKITIDAVLVAYESMGIAVEVLPSSSIEIAGQEYFLGSTKSEIGTITLNQDFAIREQGNVFIVFCMTYMDEDKDMVYDAINSVTEAN